MLSTLPVPDTPTMPFGTGGTTTRRRHVGGSAGWADGGATEKTWVTRAEESLQVEQRGRTDVKIFRNFLLKKVGKLYRNSAVFLGVLKERRAVKLACLRRKIGGGKYEIDLSVRERDTSKADAPPVSVGELKHLQIRHKQILR